MAKTIDYSFLTPDQIEFLKTQKSGYLTDNGICPTCFDKFTGGAFYGDDSLQKVYEDEDLEELLETLSYYAGETQVCFVRNGKKMLCSQKVTVGKALMAELSTFLPENCIKLV